MKFPQRPDITDVGSLLIHAKYEPMGEIPKNDFLHGVTEMFLIFINSISIIALSGAKWRKVYQ